MSRYPFPGDPLVDAPIGNTDNVIADSPLNNAGETNNVLSDNPRAGTSNIIRDLDPLSASGGYVPLNGSEPGIVLGANFNAERVDVTGNHTFNSSIAYEAAASYDGLRSVAKLLGGGGSRVITVTGTEHARPIASPVSFGGMLYFIEAQSPFNLMAVLHSASSVATNPAQNYGLRYTKSLTNFVSVPNAADFNNVTGIYDKWIHICVTQPANRTSASLYLNGVLFQTITTIAGGTDGTQAFSVGEVQGGTSYASGGYCSDVFVSSLELTPAQVLTFATNAFGETPPAFP